MTEPELSIGDLVTYDDAIHRVIHVDGGLVTLVNGKLRVVIRAEDAKLFCRGELTAEVDSLRIRCSDLEQQLSRAQERAEAWKQAAESGEAEVAALKQPQWHD